MPRVKIMLQISTQNNNFFRKKKIDMMMTITAMMMTKSAWIKIKMLNPMKIAIRAMMIMLM